MLIFKPLLIKKRLTSVASQTASKESRGFVLARALIMRCARLSRVKLCAVMSSAILCLLNLNGLSLQHFTGWGFVHGTADIQPPVLQEVPLPIQQPFRCPGIIDPRLQLCAGGAGTSACRGDSGGPLVCFDRGVWVLEGITSSGRTDCFPLQPSVFTRVSSFVDWIHSTIAGAFS